MTRTKLTKQATREMLVDYYVNGLSNAELISKYGLDQKAKSASHERLLGRMPHYQHPTLECDYCRLPLSSKYASKTKNGLSQFHFHSFTNTCLTQVDNSNPRPENLIEIESKTFRTEDGFKVHFPFCDKCGHKPHNQCRCSRCRTLKNDHFQAVVSEQLSLQRFTRSPSIELLSCHEIMLILTTLNLWKNECHGNEKRRDVALTKLDKKNTEFLAINGFISISDESIVQSVEMISNDEYVINKEHFTYKSSLSQPLLDTIEDIQRSLYQKTLDPRFSWELVDVWEGYALTEVLAVLKFYSDRHKLEYRLDEQTSASILRSLSKYGVAQTCRYVCNSVRRTSTLSREHAWSPTEALADLNKNINFWIHDSRARTYQAPPFNRISGVLAEPLEVSIFAQTFLEPWGIDYFTHPIRVASLHRSLDF